MEVEIGKSSMFLCLSGQSQQDTPVSCIARDVPSSSPSHGAISGAHGDGSTVRIRTFCTIIYHVGHILAQPAVRSGYWIYCLYSVPSGRWSLPRPLSSLVTPQTCTSNAPPSEHRAALVPGSCLSTEFCAPHVYISRRRRRRAPAPRSSALPRGTGALPKGRGGHAEWPG